MKKILILAVLFILALPFFIYAEDEPTTDRNPFDDPFAKKPEPTQGLTQADLTPEQVSPPSIKVQGIMWGAKTPLAIIDGEVYKMGDSLKGIDGKVHKIEKEQVTVLYDGVMFKMGTKGAKEEAK